MIGRPSRIRAFAVAAIGLLAAAGIVAMPVGAGADEDFVVGSGRADARLVRVGPAAGQLALAPTLGLSLADYLGTLGRGEARVFEYAALDGSIPEEWKAETPDLRVESTEENSDAGKTQMFAGNNQGFTMGVVEQSASATKTPRGSSKVKLGVLGIPGVIEIAGGVAESTAGVVEGKTREARGKSAIASLTLGGGAVTMRGLTWEAAQRSGEGAGLSGSFRVEGLTIQGQNVTVPANGSNLDAVLPRINAALAPTGIVIDAPKIATEGAVARATPLGVRIVNSPAGQATVAPVLGGAQDVRDPITGGLIENCPECSALVLVADVMLGVGSGGGRFDLEIGGVTGYTEGERFESPFDFDFTGTFGEGASNDFAGDAGAETFSEDFGAVTDVPAATSFDAAAGGLTPGTATPGGTTAGTPGDGGSQTAALAGATGRLKGAKGGAAVAVGLLGLLGALAIGAADVRTIRSQRRTIPV